MTNTDRLILICQAGLWLERIPPQIRGGLSSRQEESARERVPARRTGHKGGGVEARWYVPERGRALTVQAQSHLFKNPEGLLYRPVPPRTRTPSLFGPASQSSLSCKPCGPGSIHAEVGMSRLGSGSVSAKTWQAGEQHNHNWTAYLDLEISSAV